MCRKSLLFVKLILGSLVLTVVSGGIAAAESLSLEEVVQGLQNVYERTADLKANFVQDVVMSAVNRHERSEGTVYYKPPHRMLWDYKKPAAKKLIVNPDKAYLYVPGERAVYVQDTARLFKSQLIVRLLNGIGKVTEDFRMAFADSGAPTDGEGNYRLVMTPQKADLGVDKILVTLHRDDFTIIQCRFTDVYGNRTTVQFRNIKRNTQLSDKLFQFKPPAKTDVYPLP